MPIPRGEKIPIREVDEEISKVDIDSLVEKVVKEGINERNEKEILENILKLRFRKGIETIKLQELISNSLIEKKVSRESLKKAKELIAIAGLFSLDDESLRLVFSGADSPHLIRKIKAYIEEFGEYREKALEKLKKEKSYINL